MPPNPTRELARFMSRYTPDIAQAAQQALQKVRALLPGAMELVYDNYNALVIAFSTTERQSGLICSIALYPRWVTLFLAHGTSLPDPTNILEGSGKSIRHVVLDSPTKLDQPDVRNLVKAASARAIPPMGPTAARKIIIKAIVSKQRPRRPPVRAATTGAKPTGSKLTKEGKTRRR